MKATNTGKIGERLYKFEPQEEIDICLNCTCGDCRPTTKGCKLSQYLHGIGRKRTCGEALNV